MKIQFTRNVMVSGAYYAEGTIAEINDKTAKNLMAIRKAVIALGLTDEKPREEARIETPNEESPEEAVKVQNRDDVAKNLNRRSRREEESDV